MTTEVNSVSTAAKGALDQARWEPCHKPTMTGDGLNPMVMTWGRCMTLGLPHSPVGPVGPMMT